MPQFKIYLPKEASGYKDALHTVQKRFCDLYGGFTQWDGTGGYENHNGEIVTEPVTVVMADYSAINGYTKDMFRDEINPLGKEVSKQLPSEESLLIVVNGEKYSY